MRFFARSDDRDQKEYPISWQTLGTQRMANLTSAVLADIISKWEEYNAERAIQHARYYLHQKWASLDFEAHKGLLYDYVPLNVVFEHMPQFLINHQETPPRFWCKDAVKVEAP